MFDFIYIERAVEKHPRTRDILERFPKATRVFCERYGEVFNRRAQDFRLQKKRPGLILAEKHGNLVLETPPGYDVGREKNYYFSHMLNCVYDCRYCFLQGMYRSAHLVLFVNYEDFLGEIEETIADDPSSCFFSGYDCDSLALEPLSGFISTVLPFFARFPRALFELRTKSTQIRELLARESLKNCVVAFSLNPDRVVEALEAGTPSLDRRIDALRRLAERGWPLGLRFDPVIYHEGFEDTYREFFARVFDALPAESLHSVSLGSFRLPGGMFKTVSRLYPDEKLFAFGMADDGGTVGYRRELGEEILGFCRREILGRVSADRLFECQDSPPSPRKRLQS